MPGHLGLVATAEWTATINVFNSKFFKDIYLSMTTSVASVAGCFLHQRRKVNKV